MDLQTALVSLAVGVTAAGIIGAVSIRIISALLKRLSDKIETAPSKESVQSMIDIASLKIEAKMQSEIQMTRHDLRQEMNNHLLPLNAKFDEYSKQMTQILIAIGGIQTSTAMRRRGDAKEE